MTEFNGKAILHVEGADQEVQLTLGLNERQLIARHARNGDDEENFRRAFTADTPDVVHLSNVEIQTPNGLLRATRIDNLHVRKMDPGAMGVDDSLITRSLNLSSSKTGVVTYTLVPASSIVEFEHKPSTYRGNEVVYVGEFNSVPHHEFTIDGDTFCVGGDRKQLRVQSLVPLWSKERRIRLAASLLLGKRVSPLAAYEDGVLRINLAKEDIYKESHRLYADYASAGALFEHLLRFFLSLTEPDFRHWNKACSFLLEGKAGQTELDIGLINVFVFLEMRDNSGTLSPNTIMPLLGISLTDAKLIVKIRNLLVHQSHTLNEAVEEANAELTRNEPRYSLKCFDLSGKIHPAGVMVAFRLYERANYYLCTLIGWSKTYNTYESVLGSPQWKD